MFGFEQITLKLLAFVLQFGHGKFLLFHPLIRRAHTIGHQGCNLGLLLLDLYLLTFDLVLGIGQIPLQFLQVGHVLSINGDNTLEL